ncbi:MAG TPA: NADH-quinone oxidoreductase subunit J [Longimicrobiaceae bacterium]|nr:NADH-quinone oxidoreductase subunit J [Longimicrobiaceae bacterium]
MLTQILLICFAILAASSALVMVTRKNPVSSALWLIGTFFSLAAIYTLLGAYFIGVIQILVYAGAIMVLFLFVIMLLNLGHDYEPDIRGKVWRVVAAGSGLVMLALLARILGANDAPLGDMAGPDLLAAQIAEHGAVGAIGIPLFLDFVVPLQVTGILLLVAVVGAVVLAKRNV